MIAGWTIRIRGLVQGVGFRPTVWQLAHAMALCGTVRNTAAGVTIELWASASIRDAFLARLQETLPKLARIDRIEIDPLADGDAPADFRIVESEGGAISAAIVADAMLCSACAAEISEPGNRRFGYAFTNCTHCGPRLSIIRRIPYDRANTAMARFAMCSQCRSEYEDPANRRYHAEPTCCPDCGPRLWLQTADGSTTTDDPIGSAAALLLAGQIIGVKGLGGFHLACLARSEPAVDLLRQRKRRPSKPLALMVADIASAQALAQVSPAEAALLEGQRGPIVLLQKRAPDPLAAGIARDQDRIGMMLPTTPLHALLMQRVGQPLVMTSANESGYPQCISNEDALGLLGSIADALLLHDRDIVARVDDSVLRLDRHGTTILRRARGFAPEPLLLKDRFPETTIFAAGADLKAAFAFAGGGRVTLSQHLGDLDNGETRQAWQRACTLYGTLFEHRPAFVAVDSHPAYASSALGRALADHWDVPIVPVQHHHAHMASCLAEHGWSGDRALGIILDGTGHGEDGTIWGGEFLVGNYASMRRVAHFPAVPMIGGDRAAREPWRNAYAHLLDAFGPDAFRGPHASLACIRQLAERDGPALRSVTRSRRMSPLASSAGRLFDAAAFVLGIAPEMQDHEGQTGMALEALARPWMASQEGYLWSDGNRLQSWFSLWDGLLCGLAEGQSAGELAARFHLDLIHRIVAVAADLCRLEDVHTVALSGGVFQNALLLDGIGSRLEAQGLRVLIHSEVPANDGGIALGQAVIAAHRAGILSRSPG